jgi:hypothetical protein
VLEAMALLASAAFCALIAWRSWDAYRDYRRRNPR